MGNFDDSRFLGVTPKAIGLVAVAGIAVVGLFFMPETLKFLFDARVDTTTTGVENSPTKRVDPRASLSSVALNKSRDLPQAAVNATKPSKNRERTTTRSTNESAGILSGLDFSIPAHPSSRRPEMTAPDGLNFDSLLSKEGLRFLNDSRKGIENFKRKNRVVGARAEDAIGRLTQIMRRIASGDVGELGDEAQGIALKKAHVDALRALYADYGDRGLLLRWLNVGAISFIDDAGSVKARTKILQSFWPSFYLSDLDIRQPLHNGAAVSARYPARLRGKIRLATTDIAKMEIYSNGQLIKTYSIDARGNRRERTVSITGDAYGFWTIVAYDKYGQPPVSKTYSFYPRVTAFGKNGQGRYEIGFLPGSADNSLDRFFLVGSSVNQSARSSSDGIVSIF